MGEKSEHSPLNWWARAVARGVTGIAMGVLAAIALKVVVAIAPGLRDFSTDLGIALKHQLSQPHLSQAEQRLGSKFGYVTLDIDPGEDGQTHFNGLPAGEAACAAQPVRPHGDLADVCGERRSPNRELLASLVRDLKARGARLIVIDVVLGLDPFPFSPTESKALSDEIERGGDTPVLYAPPYTIYAENQPMAPVVLRRSTVQPITPLPESSATGGPAIVDRDEPLRRYAACLNVMNDDGLSRPTPSLPYFAALRLAGGDPATVCAGWNGKPAPRIDYSLMSRPPQNSRTALSNGRLIKESRIYIHCLAEDFSSPDGACGDKNMYRDKVVVITSTSAERGDQHLTPIGEMSGGLVIVNAIRTFLAAPQPEAEPSSLAEGFHELCLLFLSAVIWVAVWLAFEATASRSGRSRAHSAVGSTTAKRSGLRTAVSITLKGTARLAVFLLGLSAVVALTLVWNFTPSGVHPKLDLLIPVLAVGLELFAELTSQIASALDHHVTRLLSLSPIFREVPGDQE